MNLRRERVNRILSSLTGYEIRKSSRDQSLLGFDDVDLEILRAVQNRSLTSPIRILNAMNAARYVAANGIEGAIVECGVWRGGTCMAMAKALMAIDACDYDIYLFDTFAGMTRPGKEDIRILDGQAAEGLDWSLRETDEKNGSYIAGVTAFSSLSDVMSGMLETGYPTERIHFVEGDILETFHTSAPETIAVLRLDTDWYESTIHELRIGWPKIPRGGVLILDDYDYWEGARRATEEFFRDESLEPFLMRMDEGRIVIKQAS